MNCAIKKRLLLSILLFFSYKSSADIIVSTYQYNYSTPLSFLLVAGEISQFLDEIKYWEEKDIYFALEEFIRLRPFNKREWTSPSIEGLLADLHRILKEQTEYINNQIKNQYRFDYRSLAMAAGWLSLSTGMGAIGYYAKDQTLAMLLASFSILFAVVSVIDFLAANNPNRYNEYLEKYQNLLKFVQKLQKYVYPNDARKWFWQK